MTPFLRLVAEDILAKYGTNLSDIAVVFPNKRASLFLNEELARLAGKPIWSPAYITISDLFRHHSDLKVGDPIKLVCDMHRSFVKCTGISETLDHFYGWGQLLIADFDDVDKNMADADKLFANLRDIHELDDISYLSEEQKAIIKKFFSNFSDEHNTELKQRFLQLWSHFLDIYHDYKKRLSSQGKAANAGGVAVSGLEMSQNSERLKWSREEVDAKLHDIMNDIHANCVKYGTGEDGYVNYVKGANVAGFLKVAKAMMAQGIV